MEPALKLPKKILIAVKFDGRHWKLAMDAASLARKWHASLRLVHVLEPWPGEKFTRFLGSLRKYLELTEAVNETRLGSAQKQMMELVENIGQDLTVETNILSGSVVASLIADATASKADLIIGSRLIQTDDFSLKGMTTNLGLLSESPVPVLVTPDEGVVNFNRNFLRVLLCDDLTHYSERAVEVAYQFARNFERFELIHLHVNTLSEEEFINAIKGVTSQRLPAQLRNNYTDIFHKGNKAIKKKLMERVPLWIKEQTPPSCQWEVLDKEAADVIECIEKVANERCVDLIVFGRHRRLHARPFGIGKVPFSQMLRYNKAILMVGPSQLT